MYCSIAMIQQRCRLLKTPCIVEGIKKEWKEWKKKILSLKQCLQGYIHDKPHTYGAVHEQSGDAVTAKTLHDQDKNDNPARYGNTNIDQLVHITLRISGTEAKGVTPGFWHLSVCAAG